MTCLSQEMIVELELSVRERRRAVIAADTKCAGSRTLCLTKGVRVDVLRLTVCNHSACTGNV
jgi:hypothetical protein